MKCEKTQFYIFTFKGIIVLKSFSISLVFFLYNLGKSSCTIHFKVFSRVVLTWGLVVPAQNLQLMRTFCGIPGFKDACLLLIYLPLHKAEKNVILSTWEFTPLWELVVFCRNWSLGGFFPYEAVKSVRTTDYSY